MKNKNILVGALVAGLLAGSGQLAMADHHEGHQDAAPVEAKAKGKKVDKKKADTKMKAHGKAGDKHGCSGPNGCGGKDGEKHEEHKD